MREIDAAMHTGLKACVAVRLGNAQASYNGLERKEVMIQGREESVPFLESFEV